MSLTKEVYSKYKTWQQKFPISKAYIKKIKYDVTWSPFFEQLFEDSKIDKSIDILVNEFVKNPDTVMHPMPDLVFNAFMLTPFNKLSVIIIGQDPYFDHEIYNDVNVSQAMGK